MGHKKKLVDLTLLTFYGSKLRIVKGEGKKKVFWIRMTAEVVFFFSFFLSRKIANSPGNFHLSDKQNILFMGFTIELK